jgi:hypothetical protein
MTTPQHDTEQDAAEQDAAEQDAAEQDAAEQDAAERDERNRRAAATRAARRAERVEAGVAELELWLQDLVRAGFAALPRPAEHFAVAAARMVDAQAPGLASSLRRMALLPGSEPDWPQRLLADCGRLHLLLAAHRGRDRLPDELAAGVRTRIGFTRSRADVLAGPPLVDDWQVLGTRDIPGDRVITRRTWLHGRTTDTWCCVLEFTPGEDFLPGPDTPPPVGTTVRMPIHPHPGPAPQRVALGERDGAAAVLAPAPRGTTVARALDDWSAALARDPWLTDWPTVLQVVPVPAAPDVLLVDADGAAVPVRPDRDARLRLLAVADGGPVPVFLEWSPLRAQALTAWHGDEAVPL